MAETRFSHLPTQEQASTCQGHPPEEIELDGGKKSTENRNFFYNKPTRKICGVPLIIFALVALIALVLLSLLIFGILYIFGSDDTNDTTPRLEFRPRLVSGESLIWINRNAERNNSTYAIALTNYFDTDYVPDGGVNCYYGGGSSTDDAACLLDISALNKACSKENANYGYDQGKGTPCILITPTKISGWIPEPYKTPEEIDLAYKNGMPNYMVHRIRYFWDRYSADSWLDTIWITCEGENAVDRENIGELEYYSPALKNEQFQGIPAYYFPYNGQINFRMPLIFVKFIRPQHNVVMNIECKAWAKNIVHEDGYGKVSFSLMID